MHKLKLVKEFFILQSAMEFSELFGFILILKESTQLIPKCWKHLALIAILSMVIKSTLLLGFVYSLQSLVVDMYLVSASFMMPPNPASFSQDYNNPSFTNTPDPNQYLGRLKNALALILAIELGFIIIVSIISIFFTIATVLVSTLAYLGKTLSFKDLFTRALKSLKGPLVTGFFTGTHAFGYAAFCVALVLPFLMSPNIFTISAAMLTAFVAEIFYLYLLVVWVLALVISVVEESCYGMEAIGKSATLVKGNRVHGFIINVCFSLVFFILFQLTFRLMMPAGKLHFRVNFGVLFLVSFACLVKILYLGAYTVLYFRCKKNHGEEIELQGSFEYTKLPITAVSIAVP